MAASRIVTWSRCVFFRGITTPPVACSAVPSIRTSIPKRPFASCASRFQDTVEAPTTSPETPITEPDIKPTGVNARSITIFGFPKEATRSEIEALLQSKGIEVKHVQLHLDRFTLLNNTKCFIELGSEQQASQAIEVLHDAKLLSKTLVARPMLADFSWTSDSKSFSTFFGSRQFLDGGDVSVREAMRPVLERRRMSLSVEAPGWAPSNLRPADERKFSRDKITEHFGKYNIERVGKLSSLYAQNNKLRILCLIDFETNTDAEEAAKAFQGTEVEGRKTRVTYPMLSGYRARQVGKLDPELLAELQEKGLASTDVMTGEGSSVRPLMRKH